MATTERGEVPQPRRQDLAELVESIGAGPVGAKVAAVFDFDGTLIDGYSASALYGHRFRHFEIGPGEMAHLVRSMRGPTMTEEQFAALVEDGLGSWVGRTESSVLGLGRRLFESDISARVFPEAWRLVDAHQRAGHTVVIATSATELQVAPLAREFGIQHVLCTRLATEDGRLTGKVLGRTLWGPGKIAAVREFLASREIDAADSHAYANGYEDLPLLAGVGHPHPVNPQPELAEEVARRGWPVLRFAARAAPRFDPAPALRRAALFGTLLAAGGVGRALGTVMPGRRAGTELAASLFAELAGPLADLRIEVEGEVNVRAPAVFLVNHRDTLVDHLVATRVLRSGFVWGSGFVLGSGFEGPLPGSLLAAGGVRTVGRRPERAMAEGLSALAEGLSVLVAADGSNTPRVGPLREDGVLLAARAAVPLVPVVVHGAREAAANRSNTVRVAVLPPLRPADWAESDHSRHLNRVRRLYQDQLDGWVV